MSSERGISLGLRLEDAVALVFFAVNLFLQLVFSELRGENLSPADVLVIIPAMVVLLAKELVHYFVAGAAGDEPESDVRDFVRQHGIDGVR